MHRRERNSRRVLDLEIEGGGNDHSPRRVDYTRNPFAKASKRAGGFEFRGHTSRVILAARRRRWPTIDDSRGLAQREDR